MKRKLFTLSLLAALSALGAGCAHNSKELIDGTPVEEFREAGVHYVNPRSLPYDTIPPFPAGGSPKDQADLAEVTAWQVKRTPKLCAQVMAQKQTTPDHFFAHLPYEPNSETAALLVRVRSDVGKVVDRFKEHFQRGRPFVRYPKRFQPCYPEGRGSSYPSGHTTAAQVMALVLSDLDPEHRDPYMAEAKQAGLNRVIGGVHHPSDVEAGMQLGTAIHAQLKLSPDYRRDLARLGPKPVDEKPNR